MEFLDRRRKYQSYQDRVLNSFLRATLVACVVALGVPKFQKVNLYVPRKPTEVAMLAQIFSRNPTLHITRSGSR